MMALIASLLLFAGHDDPTTRSDWFISSGDLTIAGNAMLADHYGDLVMTQVPHPHPRTARDTHTHAHAHTRTCTCAHTHA